MATNPDTTKYVDLTLFDKTAQEIYEDALNYAKWVLPDWEPAETNIENVIMQAMALMVAEGQYAINRLPGALTEIFLRLLGVERSTGTAPTVTITFTVIDGSGYVIPAGTQTLYDIGDGGDPIVFTLNSDVEIPVGSTSASGVATGSLSESRFNSLASGTVLTVVTPLSYLLSVRTGSIVAGGTDPEDDTTYFTRGTLRMTRLTETLILPRHYESFALEYDTTIKRASLIDRYNPSGGTPGTNDGYITVAVFGDSIPISAAVKTGLQNAIKAAALSSLTINVIDPENLNVIGIHPKIVPLSSVDANTANAAVEAAVANYLSPLVWPWSTMIRWTNLVALIENAAGVDYIHTLEATINRLTWTQHNFYGTISNWVATTNCSVAYSTDTNRMVGGSLKVTATNAGSVVATSSGAVATNSYPATAAKEYWISARIYIPANGTARIARFGASWYNSSNALISTSKSSNTTLSPGSWTSVAVRATSPALTTKALLLVEFDSAGVAQEFYVDDITLSEFQPQNVNITLSGNAPLTTVGELVVTNP